MSQSTIKCGNVIAQSWCTSRPSMFITWLAKHRVSSQDCSRGKTLTQGKLWDHWTLGVRICCFLSPHPQCETTLHHWRARCTFCISLLVVNAHPLSLPLIYGSPANMCLLRGDSSGQVWLLLAGTQEGGE